MIYLTEYISVSAVDWGRQSDEAYEALMAGVDRNDLMTRGEIMTPIMAELAERNVKGASSKTDSAMMRGALRQFSSLVHYYHFVQVSVTDILVRPMRTTTVMTLKYVVWSSIQGQIHRPHNFLASFRDPIWSLNG